MINAAPLAMFLTTFIALIAGYPVALTLAGVALIFALIGTVFGIFNPSDLGFAAGRLFGLVSNQTLIAIPLFIFMGVTLEKTKIAENKDVDVFETILTINTNRIETAKA